MRTRIKLTRWLALVVGSLFSAAVFPAEVGVDAPEFSLSGSDGQTHELSDYRGRFVVLAFFPKAFTGG